MPRQDARTEDIRATAPATRTRALDPDASEEVYIPVQGATVFIGTGGDIAVDGVADADGTKTVFKNMGNASFIPVRVKKVYGAADGTTASDIVILF